MFHGCARRPGGRPVDPAVPPLSRPGIPELLIILAITLIVVVISRLRAR